ncbi:hypothetical protein JTB14_002495 [Gonioctena quinquepunctata]|nr:hypothetical protein JTB14_002495 [Gonioctena quinquepunctata]
MKYFLTIALALLVVDLLGAETPTVSVVESRVPNNTFEADATKSYLEAWALQPENREERIRSFSDLFQLKHPVDGGWRVAENCSVLYVPENYTYVNLNVSIGNTISTLRIFTFLDL